MDATAPWRRAVDEIPRAGVAVRAQVGRLPLPRVPRRRRGRAAVQSGPAARPLLPGGGERAARAARLRVRARRRDRGAGGRAALVRRPAAAHPSRGEPRRRGWRGSSRRSHRLRPAGRRRRAVARGAAARGAAAHSRRSRRSFAAATTPALARHARRCARARVARTMGGGLDGIVAKRLDLPYQSGRADRHAEGQAPPHRRLRGRGLPLTRPGSRVVGSLLLGLYDDDGLLHHVGFTSGFPAADAEGAPGQARAAASRRPASPAARRAGPAAGAPSARREWEPLRPAAGRRGELRPLHRRPLPPRHPLPALAARQGAAAVHPRPGRATSSRASGPPGSASARRPRSGGGSPRRAPSTSRRSSAGSRRRAVRGSRCRARRTDGRRGGGSCANTSTAAPAMRRSRSARASAASSTLAPRPTLMK